MTDHLPRLDVAAAGSLPEQEIALPSMGGSVLVRGFTKAVHQRMRREAMRADGEIDNDRLEMQMFLHGVVEPVFSEEQAQEAFDCWAAVDVDAVLQGVLEVNGLAPGFDREAAVTFRTKPGG